MTADEIVALRAPFRRHFGTPLERLMAFAHPEPNSGCWLWDGWINSKGYGRFSIKGRQSGAHRASYILHKGAVPSGLQIDHRCRVPCCVNPDHLEAVTPRENTLRGIGISATYAARTHCHKGHEFTPSNIGRDRPSRPYARRCKECERERRLKTRHQVYVPDASIPAKTCRKGHPLTEDNLIRSYYPRCRECHRVSLAQARRNRKARAALAPTETQARSAYMRDAT